MAPLTIDTREQDGTAVVALAGELDMAGAAALEREIGLLEANTIVVDLRALEFMDSSGLRAIATSAQRAQDAGRRFALVPGAAHVMRVFDITRMRERMEFVADLGVVDGRP